MLLFIFKRLFKRHDLAVLLLNAYVVERLRKLLTYFAEVYFIELFLLLLLGGGQPDGLFLFCQLVNAGNHLFIHNSPDIKGLAQNSGLRL